MKLRIYTDTSVIGGCLDTEFEDASSRLIDSFVCGEAIIVLSELTLLELSDAPKAVQDMLTPIPDDNREYVPLTPEAVELAELYLKDGVIGPGKRMDAQHIAIATIARADVLVSWNFKHIVNLDRIRGYNAVNLKHNYPMLEIRSPSEVLVDDDPS